MPLPIAIPVKTNRVHLMKGDRGKSSTWSITVDKNIITIPEMNIAKANTRCTYMFVYIEIAETPKRPMHVSQIQILNAFHNRR